ncbi:DUF3054 domain-containing protein [Natronobeatus ordinarius]|uniref:DUF3054 domain-containing protein n=1 Tax=Natronobeatus ordinarius TaxID=2963433 RepID=UPI0020CF26C1|nr:DUF3054 domain-containing protein [Natronobeatus ordinarius]
MAETVRIPGFGDGADRETVFVGVVDVALLAGLVLLGQLSHGQNPLAEPLGALEAIAPFVLAWIVVAPFAGVYARAVLSSPTAAVRVTVIGWLAAANVGFILRASPWFEGGIAWAFPLVMTGMGLLLLVGWRLAYVALAGGGR